MQHESFNNPSDNQGGMNQWEQMAQQAPSFEENRRTAAEKMSEPPRIEDVSMGLLKTSGERGVSGTGSIYQAIDKIADGTIGVREEMAYLDTIKTNIDTPSGVRDAAEKIVMNKHEQSILSFAVRNELHGDKFQQTDIDIFKAKYPTMIDFAQKSNDLLHGIAHSGVANARQKYEEYARDMASFCEHVYGDQYEAYKQILKLNNEAAHKSPKNLTNDFFEKNVREKAGLIEERPTMPLDNEPENILGPNGIEPNPAYQPRDRKAEMMATWEERRKNDEEKAEPEKRDRQAEAMADWAEREANREEKPFRNIVGHVISKSEVRGNKDDKRSGDAIYYNKDEGIMALFDGVGSSANDADASSKCAKVLPDLMNKYDFTTDQGRRDLVRELNSIIYSESHGRDSSTGVITKTVKNPDGTSSVYYVSVGDSRMYVNRDGRVEQCTRDDDGAFSEQFQQKFISDLQTFKNQDVAVRNRITELNGKFIKSAKVKEEIAQLTAQHNQLAQQIAQTMSRGSSLMMHGITRALGAPGSMDVNFNNSGMVTLNPGDKIMLCSDGITGDVDDAKVAFADKVSEMIIKRIFTDEELGMVGGNPFAAENNLSKRDGMTTNTIQSILNRSGTCADNMQELFDAATKVDDRSVIVAQV